MRRFAAFSALLVLLAAPAFAQMPSTDAGKIATGAYKLDKSHASLLFKINHLGFSMYTGRFNDFDASLNFDTAKPSNSSVQVSVAMNSVDTHNKKLEGELVDPKWFNAGKFPTATFKSTKVAIDGPTAGTVEGDLTMNGITHPVTLNVTFRAFGVNPLNKQETLAFAATGTIDRTLWNVSEYAPMVGKMVELQIEAEFQKIVAAAPTPTAAK